MRLARLQALYRYPVKGLSPERRSDFILEPGRGIPFDRMYAVDNGPSGFDPHAPVFIRKTRFVTLAGQPKTARVRTLYDDASGHIRLELPGEPPSSHDLGEAHGRASFARRLESFYTSDERAGPFSVLAHTTHRFTDHPKGEIPLINLASVRDLGGAVGETLDPLRFRANLHLKGWAPFAEMDLTEGALLKMGAARLKVFKSIVRCAAVQVDLVAGVQDLDLVSAIFEHCGHTHLGLYLSVTEGARIFEGDEVEIL